MKKNTSKLVDERLEKIIDEKAYESLFTNKIHDLFLEYGNILSKEALEKLDEYTDFKKKRKKQNLIVWETDKVYEETERKISNVWVNDKYEGFPQIITMADIETYCKRTDYPYKELSSLLAKKGYRKFGKAKPYVYHQPRLHYFSSIGSAVEWIGEDIHSKTGKYIDLDIAKSKISEIINTTETSKTKRYTYKGYMVKKIDLVNPDTVNKYIKFEVEIIKD